MLRAEALRNVESTIVELGTIFNKLGEMVAQQVRRLMRSKGAHCSISACLDESDGVPRPLQGELAIRIDENVDDTLSNVTGAQAQLMKYLNTVSSNR